MRTTQRRRRWLGVLGVLGLAASTAIVAQQLTASATVTGSDFEIEDGNLVVNGAAPAIDWKAVTEATKVELHTGALDESFGQGASEDTACPSVVDGSIPPNKSDLKTFGLYLEENAAGEFLHMYWTRVQDPKGTTNMDFEFNQADPEEDPCGNGATPVRTPGDLLITYNLSKGGTVPDFFLHTWLADPEDGTTAKSVCEAASSFPCWGKGVDLDASGDAAGSVNETAILAGNSDIGPLDAFTFGEGTIDLDAVFPEGECVNFGNAYLKSRSSDSFTSALKDFVPPLDFEITNCGSIKITKTDGQNALEGSRFTLFDDNAPTGTAWHDPTELWPGAVVTTLAEDLDDTETDVDVTDASGLSVGDFVYVDAELMEITAIAGNTLTVVRGTPASAHTNGTNVLEAVPGEDTVVTTGDSGLLEGAIGAGGTTIVLETGDGAAFASGGSVVLIGDELILVSSRSGDTLSVATGGRGYAGTTAVAHADGATVDEVVSCAPTGDPATCTMPNIFFGDYWVVETTVPAGYIGAAPQLVTVEDTTPVEVTFTNSAAPVDISIHKQTDDDSTTPSPVPICWDDSDDQLDIETGCAAFELHDRVSTTLAESVEADETAIDVDDASIFTAGDEIIVHGASLTNAETMTIDSIASDTLTVTRGDSDLTHADGAVVSLLPDLDAETSEYTCDPADATEAAAGDCTFDNVVPGSYWIHESTHPDGYASDPALPKAIVVDIGDSASDHAYTFTNPREFVVIVLVCSEADDTLYPSSVTFEDETASSLDGDDLTGTDLEELENELCGLGGAAFDDHTYGDHNDDDNAVDIPQAQP